MLRKRLLNEQSYDDRIREAIAQIPVYSSEWTNFNPSDPGITILENLSLLSTLQQESIGEMPPEVKKALLKMVGFEPVKGRPSKVLLSCTGSDMPLYIPKGQVFTVGGIKFETIREYVINDCSVKSVFSKRDDDTKDLGDVLSHEIPIPKYVFGEKPKAGDEVYFMCDKLPEHNEEAIFYIKVVEKETRNRLSVTNKSFMSDVTWSVYTTKGFKEIHSKDATEGFLFDGEVRLRMPEENYALYTDGKYTGYCIKATLNSESYDVAPRIISVYDFLFEVWQQETHSFSRVSQTSGVIELESKMVGNNYISIFAREGKGEPYHQYFPGNDEKGRFFDIVEKGNKVEYRFDKAKYGFGPEKGRNCIRLLGYNEEVMQKYNIGVVLGYDNQQFELPFKKIVSDSFFVVARREINGERVYDFVRPKHREEGELYYVLDENNGVITVIDAGNYIGATLLMGACAVFEGSDGNVRKLNNFTTEGISSKVKFFNPAPGTGGRYHEKLESVRERFVDDLVEPFAAVTEHDYENIVLHTPGLCIRKAKAYMEPQYNQVTVAVLPDILGTNGLPYLSENYKDRILEVLEERKLLTTKVRVQKPVYVQVNVSLTVYVKQHFEKAEEMIEKTINEAINHVDTEKNFGDPVRFEEVFKKIEELPCVEFIYKLVLRPNKSNLGKLVNEDVYPDNNGIIIPGKISIESIIYRNN